MTAVSREEALTLARTLGAVCSLRYEVYYSIITVHDYRCFCWESFLNVRVGQNFPVRRLTYVSMASISRASLQRLTSTFHITNSAHQHVLAEKYRYKGCS